MQTTLTTAEISSTGSSTHTIAALLGFLPERQAFQLLLQDIIVDAPKSLEAIAALWEKARKQSSYPPKHAVPSVIDVKALPSQWQTYEQELKSRSAYLRWYTGFADYKMWCVPTSQLITPQWFADLDYIEMLSKRSPEPEDWEGALNFAFGEDTVWQTPLITALNDNAVAVTFRSPAQNLLFTPPTLCPPQVRPISALEYEVAVRVGVKPNYLQVGRIQGKYIIINGVHRATALWKAGWKHIPCLVREARQLNEIFTPGTLGIIPEVQSLSRPPYIHDLFTEEIAVRFNQRNTDQVLRVLLQSDTLPISRD